MKQIWEKFLSNNFTLAANASLNKQNNYFVNDVYDDTHELYIEILSHIDDCELIEVKLPTINIPIFDGNYHKWSTLYDLFKTMIHEKTNLSAVQKLHYLLTQLSGEAKQLFENIQITEANYETVWNTLIDEYENKRLLVKAQYKILFSIPELSNPAAKELKALVDKTQEVLNALSNLDINTTTWDSMIVYIITQKLDCETHRLWEQSLEYPKNIATFV